MCTVTYIPGKNRYFLTSNRDERTSRLPAITPMQYHIKDNTLVFPKDATAGGSWITCTMKGDAGVLLNGAFVKHEPAASYRKSRGLVFLDIMSAEVPLEYFLFMDLTNIEPFTLILVETKDLHECRWDGSQKFHSILNRGVPYIWSSTTLYDLSTAACRKLWFNKWIHARKNFSQKDIINFHRFTGNGDRGNDLVMNRNNLLKTVSITSLEVRECKGTMKYLDLNNDSLSRASIYFELSPVLS